MPAFGDVAAFGAKQGTGKTAPIEKEDDLVALLEFLFHVHTELVGENGGAPLVLFRLGAHVDDPDEGKGLSVGPFREQNQVVLSGPGVLEGLERGRGGAEDDWAALEVGTDHGEIAALIFGRVFLLVGILVFFIDHDEPEVGEGSEDGGASSDHDPGLALADAMPLVKAFSLREVGVKDGDLVLQGGEAGLEMLDGLWGESDLWDEDEDRLVPVEAVLSGS